MAYTVEPGPLARAKQEEWKQKMAGIRADHYGEPSWVSKLDSASREVAAGVDQVGGPVAPVRRTYRAAGCVAATAALVGLFLVVTVVAVAITWWVQHF